MADDCRAPDDDGLPEPRADDRMTAPDQRASGGTATIRS
jgi:hypothetical protein